MVETFDVVIAGAGIQGIQAARTWLAIRPDDRLVVLDANDTLGGTWAQERLYNGLHTNNQLGTFEFTDLDMIGFDGIKPGMHMTGKAVHDYLLAYVEKHKLGDRFRFKTKVISAEWKGDRWLLDLGDKGQVETAKFIVATGLTSRPNLPVLDGQDSFNAPLFHALEVTAKFESVRKTAKRVAVYGGAKSGWDIAYSYASQGTPVDLIIRENGKGAMWLCPPFVTPLKLWLEKLVVTRAVSAMSPCIWARPTWARRFLHGTAIGRRVVDAFWWVLSEDIHSLNGFSKQGNEKMAALKPRQSAFNVGNSLSILNYDTDFFDLVRNGTITCHRADITSLSDHTIHLSTGKTLQTDALIMATGWNARPTIEFLPKGIDAELGVPYRADKPDPLIRQADSEVFAELPRIRQQPASLRRPSPDEAAQTLARPYILHRQIIPPTQKFGRSIAFLGAVGSTQTYLLAELSSLWATAWLTGQLDVPGLEDGSTRYQALKTMRALYWRYPMGSPSYADIALDIIPLFDVLLRDLGLPANRKGFLDGLKPYSKYDYAGIIEEWQRSRQVSRPASQKRLD